MLENGHAIILLLLMILSSCRTVPSDADLEKDITFYDMRFKIDGIPKIGLAVVKQRNHHSVEAKFTERPYEVRVTTCHRDAVSYDRSYTFKFDYYPQAFIEDGMFCPIEISALLDDGTEQWGFIDFLHSETLPAQISCNGRKWSGIGVSLCQSKSELEQMIEFPESVSAKTSEDCFEPYSKDQKRWFYKLSEGKCIYVFRSASGEVHRHLSHGYHILR